MKFKSTHLRSEWLINNPAEAPEGTTVCQCIYCERLYAVPNEEVEGLIYYTIGNPNGEVIKSPCCGHCGLEHLALYVSSDEFKLEIINHVFNILRNRIKIEI